MVVSSTQARLNPAMIIIQCLGQGSQGFDILKLFLSAALQIVDLFARQQQLILQRQVFWRGQFQGQAKVSNGLGIGITGGGLQTGQAGVMALAFRVFGALVMINQRGIIRRKRAGVGSLDPASRRPVQVAALRIEQGFISHFMGDIVLELVNLFRRKLLRLDKVALFQAGQLCL